MQPRRISSRSAVILLFLGLALAASWTLVAAQTTAPATEEKPAAFAYAAPALMQAKARCAYGIRERMITIAIVAPRSTTRAPATTAAAR